MSVYVYTNRENPLTLDTESGAVKNILNWIAARVGAKGWSVVAKLSIYVPGVPDTIGGKPGDLVARHGTVFFELPEGVAETDYIADGCIMSDLADCFLNPQLVALNIVSYAQLPVDPASIGNYVDPDADKPQPQDWEAPSAPIGKPYENNERMKGYFYHRGVGATRIGDVWTGPSGRKYQLEYKVIQLGVGVMAWRGL